MALEKYKKCDADGDFIDPICLLAVARTEIRRGNYGVAKSDMDAVLSRYPKNSGVLLEGIFINLLVANPGEADRLHELLKAIPPRNCEFTDCLLLLRSEPIFISDQPLPGRHQWE